MTEEQLVRAAVLDVIDGGDGQGAKWFIYSDDEDEANQERLDFTDAIIARIKQLRQMEETDDNEELEKGFNDARERWNAENSVKITDHAPSFTRLCRYFFWAGSTFGVQLTRKMYDESLSRHDAAEANHPR